jgi:hypothetical protein
MTDKIDKSKINGLQLLFLAEIKKYIESTEDIKYNYEPVVTKKHYSYKVEIKPDHANSYAVTAHIDPWEITIIFNGEHHHFTPSADYENSDGKACEAAIKFVDGLLHGNCKLVINKANEKPYRWTFYCRDFGTWRLISTGGTLWFNFFGRRSKEEIINEPAKK